MTPRRITTALATAALAFTLVAITAPAAHAAENEAFSCKAWAGPTGGPTVSGNTITGTGKGDCHPGLYSGNVTSVYNGGTVEIDARPSPSSPWGQPIFSTSLGARLVSVRAQVTCLKGTWQYRTRTRVAAKYISYNGGYAHWEYKDSAVDTATVGRWITC